MKIENTLFPGRDNYVGPTDGWFGFLHHRELCEESHDVNERVAYVKENKPTNEVAIRLHHMIYLGDCEAIAARTALYYDYVAKRKKLLDGKALFVEYSTLVADYGANRTTQDTAILAYIKSNIPDCAWNGTTLVFPLSDDE